MQPALAWYGWPHSPTGFSTGTTSDHANMPVLSICTARSSIIVTRTATSTMHHQVNSTRYTPYEKHALPLLPQFNFNANIIQLTRSTWHRPGGSCGCPHCSMTPLCTEMSHLKACSTPGSFELKLKRYSQPGSSESSLTLIAGVTRQCKAGVKA